MCECQGLEGWSLVKCIAPPRGDYEYTTKLKTGIIFAINSEGFFTRHQGHQGGLPFITTYDKHVDPSVLEEKGLVRLDDVLCGVAHSLLEAAAHGSMEAREKLEKCRELIRSILEECI
ncbi:MAG: hypothetical protein GSR82_01825 [Desulfurococcales archaeon]|nr:hypothetical protein [Desulfurococcales archaeon]MEB3772401.1 hypothetical protein [Desulfurococcales archaeon]MEB3798972.1 hypothetical protein [Desulfurococcales archaeon]MEB3845752.1 hypothetical protein [Desulfurococcales archaeon]